MSNFNMPVRNTRRASTAATMVVICAALAVMVSGLYVIWPGAAPYHPDILNEAGQVNAATRLDGALLD
ncbi:MAG: hypothetical protein ACSHWZ_01355 [Sulfitobacter sp.]